MPLSHVLFSRQYERRPQKYYNLPVLTLWPLRMLNKILSAIVNNVREHLVLYLCLWLVLLVLDVYFFFIA